MNNQLTQIGTLLQKELLVELRNKYVLGGLLLFSSSTVMLIYFSLLYSDSITTLLPSIWSVLFWLVVLFSAINSVSNAFFRETEELLMQYHFLFSPLVYLWAKMLYNSAFTILLTVMSSFIFFIVIPNPVINIQVFALTSVLGALSYAILFTLMSAIAVKAKSNNTLVAVLGFPILIPMMIFITKATASAMRDPFLTSETIKNLSLIAALDIVQIILAVILFPYIWRE